MFVGVLEREARRPARAGCRRAPRPCGPGTADSPTSTNAAHREEVEGGRSDSSGREKTIDEKKK